VHVCVSVCGGVCGGVWVCVWVGVSAKVCSGEDYQVCMWVQV